MGFVIRRTATMVGSPSPQSFTSGGITVTSNLPEVAIELRKLGDRVEKQFIRRSLTAAGAVMRALARSKAPVLTTNRKGRVSGALKRAIYSARSRRKSRAGVEVFTIGVRSKVKIGRGASAVTADPFYWYFQEKGWAPRGPGNKLRGGNRSRRLQRERNARAGARQIPGKWFLRDAAREGQQPALDAFYRRMDESFAAESKR